MEELAVLRKHIEAKNYEEALALIDELEEMSRDEKINKVESYIVILLIHLIKRKAENRTTKSWNLSIKEALRRIYKTNKRRKAGGFYLNDEEMQDAIEESYPDALIRASAEVLDGMLDEKALDQKVDATEIKSEAYQLIKEISVA